MRSTLAILTLASIATLAFAQSPPKIKEMRAGQYSYTVETEMKGIPFKVPPTTFTHCVTAADLEEGRALQSQKDAGMECKYTDIKTSGSRYQFTATCAMKDGMKMRTENELNVVSGDQFQMNVKSEISGANMPPGMGNSNTKMTMKRLGDCKK
jgi:hypothetical protein